MVDTNPEKKYTLEEWVALRYKMGQVVPKEHPRFENWMREYL